VSRIGKKPVVIPKGVEVKTDGAKVSVKGPKGTITETMPPVLTVKVEGDHVRIGPAGEVTDEVKPLWGLYRQIINNMVEGVTRGYRKSLEIQGVGYKAELKGKDMVLSVGFSYPVVVKPIPGITFSIENQTRINIDGVDKRLVGQTAADLRAIRPPEPYKGKGIRNFGEVIKLKAGKAAVK
jgi:large subunit ribosomal protein L6